MFKLIVIELVYNRGTLKCVGHSRGSYHATLSFSLL